MISVKAASRPPAAASRSKLELPDEIYLRAARDYGPEGDVAHALIPTARRFGTMSELLEQSVIFTLNHAKPDLFERHPESFDGLTGRIRKIKGSATMEPLQALVRTLLTAPRDIQQRGFERLFADALDRNTPGEITARAEYLLAIADEEASCNQGLHDAIRQRLRAEAKTFSSDQQVRYIHAEFCFVEARIRDADGADYDGKDILAAIAHATEVLDGLSGSARLDGTRAMLRKLHDVSAHYGGMDDFFEELDDVPEWHDPLLQRPECLHKDLIPDLLRAAKPSTMFEAMRSRAHAIFDEHAREPEKIVSAHRAYLETMSDVLCDPALPQEDVERCLDSFKVVHAYPEFEDRADRRKLVAAALGLLDAVPLDGAAHQEHLRKTLVLLRAYDLHFVSDITSTMMLLDSFYRLDQNLQHEFFKPIQSLFAHAYYTHRPLLNEMATRCSIEFFKALPSEYCERGATTLLHAWQPANEEFAVRASALLTLLKSSARVEAAAFPPQAPLPPRHRRALLQAMWDSIHQSSASRREREALLDEIATLGGIRRQANPDGISRDGR